MNTRESLMAVVGCVKRLHPHPDLIIASGDIAQDGSVQAYERFHAIMDELGAPSRWFPGNHDNPSALAAVAKERQAIRRAEVLGDWLLVFMNSAVPGQVHGYLADADLQWLKSVLEAHKDRHTLIAFHHHPVDIQSRWLDQIGLKNREQFFALIAGMEQIKVILCGHIHQAFDQQIGDLRILASPSTCVQFAPRSAGFSTDNQAPGYRWLALYADGSVQTGIERASEFSFVLDVDSDGY
jgi:Icc protein